MRIEQIRIQNFRSFSDQTIPFSDYTCFVGANGAGKSTILNALNVFFRNTTASSVDLVKLCDEDFHHRDTHQPIVITVTFCDLSDECREDFKAYVRNDRLTIISRATWDDVTGCAEVMQYGARYVVADFAQFFEGHKNKASVKELKDIFASIKSKNPDLNDAKTKADMYTALREYEEAHPERCSLLDSPDQFYGWSKGQNRLRRYVQWIYVPAVKDAVAEQEEGRATALGQLLERTVRSKVSFTDEISDLKKELGDRYQKILDSQQKALNGLSDSLTSRVQEWTHLGTKVQLNWHYNPDKSIAVNEPLARISAGEDEFLGEIPRLGHGLQRTLFVSLLQELANSDAESEPTLILGFEEPELYQHPPQARHVAALLEELSQSNVQVLLSTHSPYFVSARTFENVRMIRKSADAHHSSVAWADHKIVSQLLADALGDEPRHPTSTMAAIEQIMQPSQNELFFSNTAVLVEGLEDVAFISTHLVIRGLWNDFRKHGCHFVVAEGKQKLSRPLAIAKALEIPVFIVFDSDAEKFREKPVNHPRDNGCILALCGHKGAEPMPKEIFWEENCVMWDSDIQSVIRGEFGEEIWATGENAARAANDFTDGVGRKNMLMIAATMEQLAADGQFSASLDRLCDSLLKFAEKH